MKATELVRIQRSLLHERRRALQSLEDIRPFATGTGRHARRPPRSAPSRSQATRTLADHIAAIFAYETSYLAGVDAVLDRLLRDPDSFGYCDVCGTVLDGPTLEAAPLSHLCGDCRALVEPDALAAQPRTGC